MFDMFGKIKEVQAKIQEAKNNLQNVTVTSESGGGMVKATINGNRQVVKLDIDNELVKPEDRDMLQDLTIAAINKGMEDIEVKIKEELKKSTEGMLPNIPGMDFGNLV